MHRLVRRLGTLVAAITLTGAGLLATTGAAAVAHTPTVFDLNGTYADANNNLATIRNAGDVIVVDQHTPGRPDGHGVVVDHDTIFVDFPDDRSYTGTLVAPATIVWSNGTSWVKAQAVPSVLYLSIEAATNRLAAAGFGSSWEGTVIDCNVDRGLVARQTPGAGRLVRPGTTVKYRTAEHPKICQ